MYRDCIIYATKRKALIPFLGKLILLHRHGVQSRMISVVKFFVFLRLLFFALLLLYVT